jgi:DNA-binding winged helix-turn-helix (wHTH) protein
MTPESHFLFPPFRLDLANQQLWRGTQLVRLRPKAFAVLHYLVTHAHRLVTQEELRRAVWTDTVISEGLLRAYMRELRAVLEDEAQAPRFLETVHGQGYRFVAPVTTAPPVSGSKFQVSSSKLEGQPQHGVVSGSQLETWNVKLETPLVGRETELTQLHGWLEKALQGERQLVFVTGEPGIGKTSLVEAFLAHLVSRPEPAPEHEHEHELWIARGQCVEHHGAGEAYLPILEALGRLCRTAAGEQCKQLLRQQAPTWLVQMPALLEEAELEAVQRKVLGATPERMARELAEAIETLTAERPLVLWVEDLQWSDVSTLDLLLYLAQRRGPARLLVIGTYRPADVIVSGHPLRALKQELQGHGRCVELPLRVLSVAEVTQYLNRRFRLVPSPLAGEGQ